MRGVAARIVGSLAASGVHSATFGGAVENSSWTRWTVVGTVARAYLDAWEASCCQIGVRVKLDGDWIAAADLVGPVEINEQLDSPQVIARFKLVGPTWSALATRTTWTRVPVELWWYTGAPGAVVAEQRFDGYVMTCAQESGGPIVAVTCQDSLTALFSDFPLCHEVEPFAGLTRGAIVTALCADAGLTLIDCPDGAVYQRGLFTDSKKLFEFLKPFIAPEGWKMRPARDGSALHFWRPELVAAPLPAHWEWGPDRIVGCTVEPPRDVPSRWVVRGWSAVSEEAGYTTKTQRFEVWGYYKPKVADAKQEADGSVVPYSGKTFAEELRIIQIIEVQTTTSPYSVQTITSTSGWFNPSAANEEIVSTVRQYREVFIQEDGAHVAWDAERFVLITRTEQHINRTDTILTGGWVDRWGYTRRAQTSELDCAIYADDGESYEEPELLWGKIDHTEIEYGYGLGTSGPVTTETQKTSGFWPVYCKIVDNYETASGRAITEQSATWKEYHRHVKNLLLPTPDRSVGGTSEQTWGYTAAMTPSGIYDWGDGTSNAEEQTFQVVASRFTQNDVQTEDQYEEIIWASDGTRQSKIIPGRAPIARWTPSQWSRLVQQPLEIVFDDDTIEAWFGFSKRMIVDDFVQSLDELQDLLDRERARVLSFKVEVVLPETPAQVGDTVALTHPEHGLAGHRGMIVEIAPGRDPSAASPLSTYRLEVPL